eukprot:jgi/Tetstr1/430083/TSEL_019941.t1
MHAATTGHLNDADARMMERDAEVPSGSHKELAIFWTMPTTLILIRNEPAASEFCRKCGKSTTVDGLPVVREEALVSAVTEAMYDRMNGHGHHMELPTGYSVGLCTMGWSMHVTVVRDQGAARRDLASPGEHHLAGLEQVLGLLVAAVAEPSLISMLQCSMH